MDIVVLYYIIGVVSIHIGMVSDPEKNPAVSFFLRIVNCLSYSTHLIPYNSARISYWHDVYFYTQRL